MKRLFVISLGAIGIAILACVLIIKFAYRPKTAVRGDEVVRAVQQFSAAHRPLPATITFSQLIAEGFLRTNVLRDFGATEVTIYLNATGTSPGLILMDALMPDGSHTALMSDGSVQGYDKSRLRQLTSPSGGSTNLPVSP